MNCFTDTSWRFSNISSKNSWSKETSLTFKPFHIFKSSLAIQKTRIGIKISYD